MDQDIIQRGEHAARLLDDPLLKEAFAGLESLMVQSWKTTTNPEEREQLWYTLKGLERFRSMFETAVQSGQYERTLIE